MTSTVNLTMRIDRETKNSAEMLFEELGMSLSTAFNIFIKQSLRQGKIPFEISDPFYGEANMKRLRKSIAQAERGELVEHDLIEV